ncbi:MAG TPA: hypothetical protein VIV66_19500 [Pyrinomonadaceae bacterium]
MSDARGRKIFVQAFPEPERYQLVSGAKCYDFCELAEFLREQSEEAGWNARLHWWDEALEAVCRK